VPKKALGKGLEALIPQSVMESIDSEKILNLPLDSIEVNPNQPRKQFNEDSIKGLSESIREDGLLQPVVVRKRGDRYQLVLGERRLKAARLAGVATIPAMLKTVEDVDSLRLALVENLQRENLNPVDVAQAYRALIDRFGITQEELAQMIGKDRSSVANTLRLLKLPEKVRSFLLENKISEGHARAILALPLASEQIALAERIVRTGLSVREAEASVGEKKGGKRERKADRTKPPHITFLENAISQYLATKVAIEEKRGGKGRMVIDFYSHDDFERLCELMQIPLPR
jgi:ParB family chromosome partitioning protein